MKKLYEIFCCDNKCCDCCFGSEKKLTKSDIQHSFRESSARLDSTSSAAESTRSFRERMESDNASSRTDSVSSASQLSGEYRRGTTTPVIDMKPIEFWAANRESVQPKQHRRRLPSETEISVENFQPDLYEEEKTEPCLTDEEKLAKFQLGQIHIGLNYEVSTKVLMVKIIEAKDLPRPFSMDENKQDMAHSNPYCKVCLLPDQKNSQQTSVQRKTQEPTWNEYFMFEIPYSEVQMRTLEILVKDFDKYSRHCIIGQVYLPLTNLQLLKGVHMWKPLSPSTKVAIPWFLKGLDGPDKFLHYLSLLKKKSAELKRNKSKLFETWVIVIDLCKKKIFKRISKIDLIFFFWGGGSYKLVKLNSIYEYCLKKTHTGNYFLRIFNWFDKLITSYGNKHSVASFIIILI